MAMSSLKVTDATVARGLTNFDFFVYIAFVLDIQFVLHGCLL